MGKQKKIMFLGASQFQIAPIKYAKEQGHYVITCDYLPDNPGHKFSDEYHNVSTIDKDAILKLAQELEIDGIVSYASDVSAPTQAYVANKMGFPSNPYESVLTLQRKDLFRDFLEKNGFYVPKSRSFYDHTDATDWFEEIKKPVIVKPVDSSGSKGVSKIKDIAELKEAFEYAKGFSIEKKVVIEEFFLRDGYQVAGDGFIVDGKLTFWCWANEHFDKLCNPFVPIGESFPSIMSDKTLQQAYDETQRLLDLLDMKHGALNFDFHYDSNGDFSFLELGPRNGGNLIPEVTKYATGIDMIKYTVDSALGMDCSSMKQTLTNGYYSSYILHAIEDGVVQEIYLSDEIKKNILEQDILVSVGDKVRKFDDTNHTLGTFILKFGSEEEMLYKMDNMEEHIRVVVQ